MSVEIAPEAPQSKGLGIIARRVAYVTLAVAPLFSAACGNAEAEQGTDVATASPEDDLSPDESTSTTEATEDTRTPSNSTTLEQNSNESVIAGVCDPGGTFIEEESPFIEAPYGLSVEEQITCGRGDWLVALTFFDGSAQGPESDPFNADVYCEHTISTQPQAVIGEDDSGAWAVELMAYPAEVDSIMSDIAANTDGQVWAMECPGNTAVWQDHLEATGQDTQEPTETYEIPEISPLPTDGTPLKEGHYCDENTDTVVRTGPDPLEPGVIAILESTGQPCDQSTP